MADNIYPTDEQFDKYWKGQNRRAEKRLSVSIPPIFDKATNKITKNTLEVLDNRQYLKIDDPRKRARRMRKDEKIVQVEKYIISANAQSLQVLYNNLVPHYHGEIPMICQDLYPWMGECKSGKLTQSQLLDLRDTEYEGDTYDGWIRWNQNIAVTEWNRLFSSVMGGSNRTATAKSKDVVLLRGIHKILDKNERANSTVFLNSQRQTSRQAQTDLINDFWGTELRWQ